MIAPLLQVFGEPFHEYTHAEEGEAVMGKEYEGKFLTCGGERVGAREGSGAWAAMPNRV